MKTRSSWIGLVLLIAVALGGVAGYQALQDDDDVDGMTLRYVNFRIYDPVYVAIDNGYFAERGLTVEVIGDVLAGPTAIQAVASGSAEAGVSSIPAIINANAAGLPIVGVSDLQSALETQPLEVYFKRAGDDTITDVASLEDHPIAINLIKSSFHYTLIMAFEQVNLTEDDANFILLPFDRQVQALLNNNVDLIGLMEPYISQAQADYGDDLDVVFTALDVFGAKQFSLHFVNRIWAENNPEAATAFVGGIVEAVEWIEANPDEAAAIISTYTGVDQAYIGPYHYQPDARVVMEDVQFWLDYLVERGDVTADWLAVDTLATNQYNPNLQ